MKTYKMAERSERLDFEIRDQQARAPVVTPHRHEFFQIEANVSGSSHHFISGQRREYRPRSLLFTLPYRVHCALHPPEARYYVINFAAEFLRPGLALSPLALEEAPILEYPELSPFIYEGRLDFTFDEGEFEEIVRLIDRMMGLHANRKLGTQQRLRGALLDLIGFATECHSDELQALADRQGFIEGRSEALQRVAKFIDSNLSRPISLNEAAEAAFLSPNYLSQLLKKQTGQAFVEWLTVRRMHRAREMLAHRPDRISAVAKAVGFADEAYFARRFNQQFGMSPTKYRQSLMARA